jgi:hypothetical protein
MRSPEGAGDAPADRALCTGANDRAEPKFDAECGHDVCAARADGITCTRRVCRPCWVFDASLGDFKDFRYPGFRIRPYFELDPSRPRCILRASCVNYRV